jgi:hypothetical protein
LETAARGFDTFEGLEALERRCAQLTGVGRLAAALQALAAFVGQTDQG